MNLYPIIFNYNKDAQARTHIILILNIICQFSALYKSVTWSSSHFFTDFNTLSLSSLDCMGSSSRWLYRLMLSLMYLLHVWITLLSRILPFGLSCYIRHSFSSSPSMRTRFIEWRIGTRLFLSAHVRNLLSFRISYTINLGKYGTPTLLSEPTPYAKTSIHTV